MIRTSVTYTPNYNIRVEMVDYDGLTKPIEDAFILHRNPS